MTLVIFDFKSQILTLGKVQVLDFFGLSLGRFGPSVAKTAEGKAENRGPEIFG